jgi:hypothetical protein
MINLNTSALSVGLALGVVAIAAVALAETTVTTTKTTTYVGTVSEINPTNSTIILRSAPAAAPVTYSYSKETTFVDAAGNVVTSESIRNSPVTVEYTNEGGQMIVRRVVQNGPATAVVLPGTPAVVVPAAPVVTPPAAMIREKTTTHTEKH